MYYVLSVILFVVQIESELADLQSDILKTEVLRALQRAVVALSGHFNDKILHFLDVVNAYFDLDRAQDGLSCRASLD